MLAGGQSLIPILNMRLAAPAHVVDINFLAGRAGRARAGGRRALLRAARAAAGRRAVGAGGRAAAAADRGAVPRRPPGDPLTRDGRRQHRARRSGGRAAGRARAAGGRGAGAQRERAPDRAGGASCSPVTSRRASRPASGSRRCACRCRTVAARRSRSSRAGRATTRCAGSPPSASGDRVALSFVGMGAAPARFEVDDVRAAVEQLEPEDDIHATARYRRWLAERLGERAVRRLRGAA